LGRYERRKEKNWEAEHLWALPFYWESKITGAAPKHRFKVWPFFRWEERGKQGRWAFPSLLPFFDQKTELFWERLWALGRGRWSEKENEWELLWGLWLYGKSKEKLRWSFLGGLLGWESSPGETCLRVFYLPISWKRSTS